MPTTIAFPSDVSSSHAEAPLPAVVSRLSLSALLGRPRGLDLMDLVTSDPEALAGSSCTAPPTLPLTPEALGCSLVAWDTLLRDGDLVPVREGFALVAGTRATAAHRASTLVSLVPEGVVLARGWAAWVHTGGTPPPEAPRRVCVVYGRGDSRPRTTPGLDTVRAALRPWDVDSVADLRLTSALRTTMDLATWGTPPEVARVLPLLLTSCVDAQDVLAQLDRVAGWRGADRARDRIMRAAERPSADEAGGQQPTTGSARRVA